MGQMSVIFDPEDAAEVDRALAWILRAAGRAQPEPMDLDRFAEQLVRGYGRTRRDFLRDVALASASGGLAIEDAPVQANALGGLMSSLGKWRVPGTGAEVVAWTGNRYLMGAELAAAVLGALERTDAAPDPDAGTPEGGDGA